MKVHKNEWVAAEGDALLARICELFPDYVDQGTAALSIARRLIEFGGNRLGDAEHLRWLETQIDETHWEIDQAEQARKRRVVRRMFHPFDP